MSTKMELNVTIKPKINSYEVFERLRPYGSRVMDLGDQVFITSEIEYDANLIEGILDVCKEYGECTIEAYLVEEPPLN